MPTLSCSLMFSLSFFPLSLSLFLCLSLIKKNTTCITILEEIMCTVTVCLMRLYVLNYKLFIQCYSAMRKRNANRPKNNNKTAAIRHNKTNPDIFEMHKTRTKWFFPLGSNMPLSIIAVSSQGYRDGRRSAMIWPWNLTLVLPRQCIAPPV